MRALAGLIRDYEWIYLGLGLAGNGLFVCGSICFLFPSLRFVSISLFIAGSSLMLMGATGNALIKFAKVEGDGALGEAARGETRA
jgi:hypothetical protein